MPNIMQPDKSSRENIMMFLESIENEGLKNLINDHLDAILSVGNDSENQEQRQVFMSAVKTLIENQMANTQ